MPIQRLLLVAFLLPLFACAAPRTEPSIDSPDGAMFVSNCIVIVRPPVQTSSPNIQVQFSQTESVVRATLSVSQGGMVEVGDFTGQPFLEQGTQTPLNVALAPGGSTFLEMAYDEEEDQLRISGEINGQAIEAWTMEVNGSPSGELIDRIGEDDLTNTSSRIRFFFRGFRTGFSLSEA